MEEQNKFTYRQLAEAINNMPDELKDRRLIVWPSEDSETELDIVGVEILDEDYLCDGEAIWAASAFDEIDEEENYVVHPKGMVVLITE
jgi:hypothetical protein